MYHITAWYWFRDNWFDKNVGEHETLEGAKKIAEEFFKEMRPYSVSISNKSDLWKWKGFGEWKQQK